MPCVPFETVAGMPFIVVVIASPDSTAAAHTHVDEASPQKQTGSLHTLFRLFAHYENDSKPFCNQGSCYQLNGGSAVDAILPSRG